MGSARTGSNPVGVVSYYLEVAPRAGVFSLTSRSRSATAWPSGLRRQLKALVRKGVGSNPTAVILRSSSVCELAPRGPGALRTVGALAQLVARRSHNPKVVSSILTRRISRDARGSGVSGLKLSTVHKKMA